MEFITNNEPLTSGLSTAPETKKSSSSLCGNWRGENVTQVKPESNLQLKQTIATNGEKKFPIIEKSILYSSDRIKVTSSTSKSSSNNKEMVFEGDAKEAQEIDAETKQYVDSIMEKASCTETCLDINKRQTQTQEFLNTYISPCEIYTNELVIKNYLKDKLETEKSGIKKESSENSKPLLLDEKDGESNSLKTSNDNHKQIETLDTKNTKVEVAPHKEKLEGVVEKINSEIGDYLKSKGVMVGEFIGQGGFGKVFLTKIDNEEFVYKKENKNRIKDINQDLEDKGARWRHGDIAASRCKDLSHFAKTIAFVLLIKKPNCERESLFVATDQIKGFLKQLPAGTQVGISGQIMKKAPGVELEKLLGDKNFNPVDHFDHIANSLFSFLETTYHRNLIHRDLKPANFMYDPITREGTVIDFGVGSLFGKREKMKKGENVTKSGRQLYSKRFAGTQLYLAPTLFKKEGYASEVDFHSAAAMLVELLDTETFLKTNNKRRMNNNPVSTKEYISENSNSKLVQTLKQHPDMAKTIDLFFNVASTTPDKRDDAFNALKNHMEVVVRPKIGKQHSQES
jgi:serine/threonine protein kinase